MPKAKTAKKANKWKDKEWYKIEAPEIFEEKGIGETPAIETDELEERTIETSLRDLTGKRNHNNIKIKFKIEGIEGETIRTKIKSFKVTRDYIRKNIRKGRSVIKTIEDIEVDDKNLHVTVYAFTVGKLHSSKEKKIRKIMSEELHKQSKENNFDSLVQKMIFGKTATALFKEAKEIAPIKRIEITKCEVEEGE